MNNEEIIKNAQYRKNLSIAFFNATNAAIELVKTDYIAGDNLKTFIIDWRNWFLEEHKVYYAKNIANIGLNYSAEEAIKRLQSAKTLDQLKDIWINLSEDERQDEMIKTEAQNLKKQLS